MISRNRGVVRLRGASLYEKSLSAWRGICQTLPATVDDSALHESRFSACRADERGRRTRLAGGRRGDGTGVLAVARTMPAVVNINTERMVKRTVRDPYDDFFNSYFGGAMRPPRTFAKRCKALVQVSSSIRLVSS
jgi:hypothetical protein